MGDPFPSPPPVVRAFRESFGDRKLPDISRKITACVACRKQKVKCHMKDGEVPCSRCKKRGLSCTVNRSLQILLEDDVTWKEVMSQKIQRLEESMDQVVSRIDVAELQHQGQAHPPRQRQPQLLNDASTTSSTSSQHPPPRWQVVMNSQGGPASSPASCVSELRTTASSGNMPASRLDAIRKRSPLLTAAVCTVGALHAPSLGHLYDICYREYKSLATAITLSTTSNVDDVRGLCIGAFWLHELPWALIGTAVRIASDLKLHHGIYRALKGDREGYLQARLYYLVYVCAHHFSVAYSRPSMSREKLIVDSAGHFLETEHATEHDTRLISQKGVGMHWNFAKLYLCSHAFRGVSTVQERSQSLPPELEEIANMGVLSAMSILNVIVSDDERRSFLHGLPLYFDTMIAFAVVFLLKVATKYTDTIRIDTDKILFLVSHTVAALNEITHYMHPQHLLVAIAEGLQKLLWKCQEQSRITQEPMQQLPATLEHSPTEMAWMESITNFDFLTSVPNVDDWVFHYPVATGAHPTHYNP
ncbi:hypothetical protein EYB25_004621 [Talaromyces marneffei]|nr:hypothetical protein EYB25_004621 [Talaromyces marneffei]